VVGKLGIPVAFGVHSGHVTTGNITLPIGVRAELTVHGEDVNLRILEESVTAAKASTDETTRNVKSTAKHGR
jgi:hypothetical protein